MGTIISGDFYISLQNWTGGKAWKMTDLHLSTNQLPSYREKKSQGSPHSPQAFTRPSEHLDREVNPSGPCILSPSGSDADVTDDLLSPFKGSGGFTPLRLKMIHGLPNPQL